ncbi:hypothetical protein [Micromonospora sp. KC213]|nr:hypothetical protein [Micromonospora sp. KC213]
MADPENLRRGQSMPAGSALQVLRSVSGDSPVRPQVSRLVRDDTVALD